MKSVSSISYSSLGSEVYWKIVRANAKDAPSDDYLLENTEDQIIEALESNVYLVKNGIIKGASIDQGAYIDITKPLMLDIFKKLKLNYTENEGISEQDLNEADEIFVVNAVDGIRWVVGFEGKRYFNQTTRKINDLFINNLPN